MSHPSPACVLLKVGLGKTSIRLLLCKTLGAKYMTIDVSKSMLTSRFVTTTTKLCLSVEIYTCADMLANSCRVIQPWDLQQLVPAIQSNDDIRFYSCVNTYCKSFGKAALYTNLLSDKVPLAALSSWVSSSGGFNSGDSAGEPPCDS